MGGLTPRPVWKPEETPRNSLNRSLKFTALCLNPSVFMLARLFPVVLMACDCAFNPDRAMENMLDINFSVFLLENCCFRPAARRRRYSAVSYRSIQTRGLRGHTLPQSRPDPDATPGSARVR